MNPEPVEHRVSTIEKFSRILGDPDSIIFDLSRSLEVAVSTNKQNVLRNRSLISNDLWDSLVSTNSCEQIERCNAISTGENKSPAMDLDNDYASPDSTVHVKEEHDEDEEEHGEVQIIGGNLKEGEVSQIFYDYIFDELVKNLPSFEEEETNDCENQIKQELDGQKYCVVKNESLRLEEVSENVYEDLKEQVEILPKEEIKKEIVDPSQLIYNVKKLETKLTEMIRLLEKARKKDSHLQDKSMMMQLKFMSSQMMRTGIKMREKVKSLQRKNDNI